MALNETDKAWVRLEIQAAMKRRGWGKLTGFIKDWSGAGAAAGILILVFTQWTGYTEFRVRTGDRLDSIERKLDGLRDELTKQSLADQAILFGAKQQENTRAPYKLASTLATKLVQSDKSTPDYWPTAAEFISYRSQIVSPDEEVLLNSHLPNCVDSDPFPIRVAEVDSRGAIRRLENAHYDNCRFTLDSMEDDGRIMDFVSKFGTIEFRHCLIVYKGGDFIVPTYLHIPNVPIKAITGKGRGGSIGYDGPALQFVDCIFDFSAPGTVPAKAQRLIEALLPQSGAILRSDLSNGAYSELPSSTRS
jgi:hypothetical protein